MTLRELVTKNGTPDLCDRLQSLEEEAQFGRQCRENLISETVTLGLLLDFGAQEATLRKAFSALSSEELTQLKAEMSQRTAALFPPNTQLPAAGAREAAMEAAYMI